jgi:hypothetical protein
VLYEIAEEAPGQAISVQTPATLPPGRERLVLSAAPQGRGTRATITASSLGARRLEGRPQGLLAGAA